MKTTYWPLVSVILVSISIAASLVLRAPDFPFTPDSAFYIEQARNMLQEGSALTYPYSPSVFAKTPDRLFPIGLPIALAAISLSGIDPREASIVLSWVSAILLPLIFYISFKNSLGDVKAALLAALAVSSPGILNYAPMGMSDLFALLIATSAIGLVLNARCTSLFAVNGVVVGFAYAVRNANLALLVTLTLYFFYLWLSRPLHRTASTKHFLALLAGAALVIVPVLLRNISLFGVANPYTMEASTIGLIENVRTYISEFFYDLTASRSLGTTIGWSISGFVALLLAMLGFCQLILRLWPQLPDDKKDTLFLCTTYSIVGAAVVIAARSRYEWGETINIRHTLQYVPFFWVALLAVIPRASRPALGFKLRHSGIMLVLAVGVLHLAYLAKPQEFARLSRQDFYAANAFQQGERHLCTPTENSLLVSNWALVFRILCNTGVRFVNLATLNNMATVAFVDANQASQTLVKALVNLSSTFKDKPIKAGFYPSYPGEKLSSLLGDKNDVLILQESGWVIIQHDDNGLLLAHP